MSGGGGGCAQAAIAFANGTGLFAAAENPEVKIRFDIVEVLLADGQVHEVRHLPNTFAMAKPYRYG